MIRLTCLLRRKKGMTPSDFQDYWQNQHGPLVARSKCGRYAIRYEQHPRPLDDYAGLDDRSGYDGVTVQWFESMEAYRAHMAEEDFASVLEDTARFLDTDHLEYVLTEEPRIIVEGPPGPPEPGGRGDAGRDHRPGDDTEPP